MHVCTHATLTRMTPTPTVDPLLAAPILPTLIRFAVPNMGAMVASALAAIAETRYVGTLGVGALAGMALVFPMVMLQGMLSGGAMGGGISSAVSRAFGAGDVARANALAVHATWIAIAAGLLLMVLMLVFGGAIYSTLGGSGEALAQALVFSNVAFLGSLGMWLVNTFASVIRGSGNMAVPSGVFLAMAATQLLVGGALGLGFGPLPSLGMPGIAAGQVVATGAGALFLYGYLRSGRARVQLRMRATPLQPQLLRDILKVGALACIAPLQTVLVILILTRLVAHSGSTALAGYGIGTRLEFLLVPIVFAIGVASVPLVGTAIGAGRVARARQVAWVASAVAAVLLGLIGVALALAPGMWTHLFTDDAAVLASAALYFHWAGPCYALYGLGLCLYFSSLGAGKVGGPVLAGTLRLLLVAVGGWMLATNHAEPWAIFALVALAMAVYGIASAVAMHVADWGVER